MTSPAACSVGGCGKSIYARGWCSMHYWRWRKHGDTSACTTNRYIPMLDRFWMKVQKGPGCWLWTGGARGGYGTFTEGDKGKTHLVHRFSYELLVGPIPDCLVIDHMCRVTLCVNPAHLRPVTRKQNGERRDGPRHDSTTGVLGVSRNKKDGLYWASVGHHGKRVHGGRFETLEEAAKAVKELRIELFTHNDGDRMVP